MGYCELWGEFNGDGDESGSEVPQFGPARVERLLQTGTRLERLTLEQRGEALNAFVVTSLWMGEPSRSLSDEKLAEQNNVSNIAQHMVSCLDPDEEPELLLGDDRSAVAGGFAIVERTISDGCVYLRYNPRTAARIDTPGPEIEVMLYADGTLCVRMVDGLFGGGAHKAQEASELNLLSAEVPFLPSRILGAVIRKSQTNASVSSVRNVPALEPLGRAVLAEQIPLDTAPEDGVRRLAYQPIEVIGGRVRAQVTLEQIHAGNTRLGRAIGMDVDRETTPARPDDYSRAWRIELWVPESEEVWQSDSDVRFPDPDLWQDDTTLRQIIEEMEGV